MRNRQVETPLPTLGIGEVASKSHKVGTIFESASRAAATYVSDTIGNYECRGLRLFFDLTNVGGAGTVTAKIQVRDPVSGNWIDLPLAVTPALAAVATTMLTVYPGLSYRRKSVIRSRLLAADASRQMVVNPGVGFALRVFRILASCVTSAAQQIDIGVSGNVNEQLMSIPASATLAEPWESEEGNLQPSNTALTAVPAAAGPAWQFLVEYQVEAVAAVGVVAVNSPLGLEWRLSVTVGGNAVTFSVGGQYLD